MSKKTVQFVDEQEIRALFNEYILPEKAKGELFEIVRNSNHPARSLAREPFCTESQLVVYYDKNFQEIANAHQYLRQDGSLGASGKPDPKMVVLNEIIYKIRKQP